MAKVKVIQITIVLVLILLSATSSGYSSNQACQLGSSNIKYANRALRIKKVSNHYMNTNPKLWAHLANYMAESTVTASEEYKVPLNIVVGVNTKESRADPFAKSRTGAKGTSQINFKACSGTFPGITSERDKYDPRHNIRCAAYLLRKYIKKYGISNALHAYNLGEHAFLSGRRNPKYVKDVLRYAQNFESTPVNLQ